MRESVCERYFKGSTAFRWIHSREDTECHPCTGSYLLRSGSWIGWILLGTLLLTGLQGSILSDLCWITAVILAYRYPAQAVLFLPTALLLSIPIFSLRFGVQSEFLRLDQALVFAITARLLTQHRIGDSRLYVPIAFCLMISAMSILVGMRNMSSSINPLASLLQQIELFLIFVCTYSLGPQKAITAVYAWCLPVIAAGIFGMLECTFPLETLTEGVYRAFERGYFIRQANHFAGVFAMAAPVGIALALTPRGRILGISLLCCACAGLASTHSREGFCALVAGCLALICLRFPYLTGWILGGVALGLVLVLDYYWERITMPNGSLYARFEMWQAALSTFPDFPLLGIGTGVRPRSQYDNIYIMILSENGLGGLAAWSAWLLLLLRKLAQAVLHKSIEMTHKSVSDPTSITMALILGSFGALVALIVQGSAAIVFLITITTGMLYWIAGYAAACCHTDTIESPRA